MNKQWVLFHVREAIQDLQGIAAALESSTVTSEEFDLALEHAYHHMNVAWNSRSITNEEAARHIDADFVRWRQFPKNLNL